MAWWKHRGRNVAIALVVMFALAFVSCNGELFSEAYIPPTVADECFAGVFEEPGRMRLWMLYEERHDDVDGEEVIRHRIYGSGRPLADDLPWQHLEFEGYVLAVGSGVVTLTPPPAPPSGDGSVSAQMTLTPTDGDCSHRNALTLEFAYPSGTDHEFALNRVGD